MTTSVSTYLTAQLQANGLSASEASAVIASTTGLPAFQWSGWLWAAPDYTALSSQALTILWGAICYETVALIDGLEHGHWARPVFASQSIVIT